MNATTASAITKAASSQTYYTIRLLADRDRLDDAYRAYGYFRWVDDILDAQTGSQPERIAFLQRQHYLLDCCYQGTPLGDASIQEHMLADLVQHDQEEYSGLQIYLRNMMRVMDFDVRRRGRLISQAELNEYTYWLASAVTECIHYFIGHGDASPHDSARYMAVSAAHIAHMLRDTFDDAEIAYYNIPAEVLGAGHIGPLDVRADAYRTWVKSRVVLARRYFKAGKAYFARVHSARCRLACFAYIARFEWLLDTVEKEGYVLRPEYSDRKSKSAALQMVRLTLASMFGPRGTPTFSRQVASQQQDKAWRRNP